LKKRLHRVHICFFLAIAVHIAVFYSAAGYRDQQRIRSSDVNSRAKVWVLAPTSYQLIQIPIITTIDQTNLLNPDLEDLRNSSRKASKASERKNQLHAHNATLQDSERSINLNILQPHYIPSEMADIKAQPLDQLLLETLLLPPNQLYRITLEIFLSERGSIDFFIIKKTDLDQNTTDQVLHRFNRTPFSPAYLNSQPTASVLNLEIEIDTLTADTPVR
jgi:hypothetical protein